MNKPKTHLLSNGRRVALASLSAALFLGGCSVSTSANSNTAADANASNRASSNSGGGSRAEASAKSSASAKGGSSAHASGKASGKFSGSSKAVFTTKSRVTGMGKAKTEDHFKATILVGGGKGKASASAGIKAGGSAHADGKGSGKDRDESSGKVSTDGKGSTEGGSSTDGKGSIKVSADGKGSAQGSGSAKGEGTTKTGGKGASNAEKAASGKGQTKPGKDNNKPEKGDSKPGKTPEKGDKPGKDEKPAPEEPIVVIDPPEAPPENVFGYETPVRGCFEGIVYPIASNSKSLPTDWNALTAVSVVYACEWDIPTRKWDAGFPGVEDRFEWFAIQYSGSFNIQTGGKWKFRISSDDGAKLFIDGKLIMDNDGVHPPKEKEVEVDLSAGDHEMVLEYFQGPRYHINLQLFATPPGGEEGVFSVR